MLFILKGMTLWVRSLTDGKDFCNDVNVSPGSSPWVEVNGANSMAVAIGVQPYLNCKLWDRIIYPPVDPRVDGR
jgi:hypothetical protein